MGRYHEERALAPYQPSAQNEIGIESSRPAERPRAPRGMDWRMLAVMMVGMLVMLALLPFMKTVGLICFGLFCLGALWLVFRGLLNVSGKVLETMERREDLIARKLQNEEQRLLNEEKRLLNQRYREALIQKDGERVMGVWARPDDPHGAFQPLYDPGNYHFHQGRQQLPAPVSVQELPPGPLLPEREDFAAYLPRINAKHMLLGWRLVNGVSKAIWVSIELLLSCVIVGPPNSGKSSLLRTICAEAILASAQVAVFDNHGSVARALKNAQSYALGDRLIVADPASPTGWSLSDRLVFNFSTAEEIETGMGDLLAILDGRLEEYRAGRNAWRPLLVLVDEWPQQYLMFNKQKHRLDYMLDGLQRLICEGRKVAIYVLLSGQSLPARLLGDDTLIKQNCPNKIALHHEALQAQMIGIAQKEYQPFLDTLAQVFGEALNNPEDDPAAGLGMLKIGAVKGYVTAFPYCDEPLLLAIIQDVWQRQPPPVLFTPEMSVLSESLYPQVAQMNTAPTGRNDPTEKNPVYSAQWHSAPGQTGSKGSVPDAPDAGLLLPATAFALLHEEMTPLPPKQTGGTAPGSSSGKQGDKDVQAVPEPVRAASRRYPKLPQELIGLVYFHYALYPMARRDIPGEVGRRFGVIQPVMDCFDEFESVRVARAKAGLKK